MLRNTLERRFSLVKLEDRVVPATFTVINANDSGSGSLRQAVLSANAAAGTDSIVFDSVAFATPQTITLTSGRLDVTGSVTIKGPGAALATVSGNKIQRLFYITNGINTNILTVNISGLTLRDGAVGLLDAGGACLLNEQEIVTVSNCVIMGHTSVNKGGAIASAGGASSSLTLSGCVLTGNTTTGTTVADGGGAVSVTSNFATIQDCTLSDNTSVRSGGAILTRSGSIVTILRCTLSNNKATGGPGGAIVADGKLTVTDSLISGNQSGSFGNKTGGGGVYIYYGQLGATFTNSTVSGNVSEGPGGGIRLQAFDSLTVNNCTITANTATSGAGGGISAAGTGSSSVSITSSIVSGNMNTSASDISFAGTVTLNNSAVGSTTGFTSTGTKNLFATDLKLGTLGNNGGPTKTQSLLLGSPCLNAGSNPGALSFDQRGTGFKRSVGTAVDIGAFEVQPPRVASFVVNGNAVQRSRVTELRVTFDQPVTLPANPAAAFQLTRQGDNTVVNLAAAVDNNGPGTIVTITFTGGTVDGSSLADGRFAFVVVSAQVSGAAAKLDGNGDGTAGDNYVLIGTPANGLFRLFGDSNGDGTVNGTDFLAFRSAFLGTGSIFDFDGSGQVNDIDFLQFRLRFLQSV